MSATASAVFVVVIVVDREVVVGGCFVVEVDRKVVVVGRNGVVLVFGFGQHPSKFSDIHTKLSPAKMFIDDLLQRRQESLLTRVY